MAFVTTETFQCEQTYTNVILYIYNINQHVLSFVVITPKKLINSDSKTLKVSEEIKQLLWEIKKLDLEESLDINRWDTPLSEVEKVRGPGRVTGSSHQ